MDDVDSSESDSILAAVRRLTGHLVDTPMIGELRLPGFGFHGVRVKAECLQMGGTLMFRGYLHCLLRSLGQWKGLVLGGTPREVYAQAVAVSLHRLPAIAVVEGELDPSRLTMIRETGCEVQAVAVGVAVATIASTARARGFQVMAGLADADVRHGVATLGVELAADLPREVEEVRIAPPALAAPIRAGLLAAGRVVEVLGVESSAAAVPVGLAVAVADGLRLCSDLEGLAALASVDSGSLETRTAPTCVVLSS